MPRTKNSSATRKGVKPKTVKPPKEKKTVVLIDDDYDENLSDGFNDDDDDEDFDPQMKDEPPPRTPTPKVVQDLSATLQAVTDACGGVHEVEVLKRRADELEETPVAKKRDRSKRNMAPVEGLDESMQMPSSSTATNFSCKQDTPYLTYFDDVWTPQYLYRLPADLTLQAIRESGGEGTGRIEIGYKLAMDTSTKGGNRRVSSYIQNVCGEHKRYIGQFQKMEGKYRCIKYYWKSNSPQQFTVLFDIFEQLAGIPCPFKLGEVVKFPNCNLSTLRMSDVSLRRLNYLLDMVHTQRVIVTLNRVIKQVTELEMAASYKFVIDKKSLMKCIFALQNHSLLRIFDTNVTSEGTTNKVQILCHPEIQTCDCTEVQNAIQETLDQYQSEGRVFPHGQFSGRYALKQKEERQKQAEKEFDEQTLRNIKEEVDEAISVSDRFQLFRLQKTRSAVVVNRAAPIKTLNETLEPELNDDTTAEPPLVEDEKMDETGAVIDNGEESKNSIMRDMDMVEMMSVAGSTYGSSTHPLTTFAGRKQATASSVEFGYQPKAIRMMVMHEVLYHMIYANPDAQLPDLYKRFNVSNDISTWPEVSVDSIPFYVKEISHLSFIPPLRPFKDVQRGWFMLQDLMYALPLSVYVFCIHLTKDIPRDLINEYLSDNVKRHLCIGDLPAAMRTPMLRDKRAYRQLEHVLLMLGAMGLVAAGPNPDSRRFASSHSTIFFLATRGVLHDTSTSARGYAAVTMPIQRYDRYVYDFNTADDVSLYWHHLRAIVQSTPLSFRHDTANEDMNPIRHKKYSQGVFDASSILRDTSEVINELSPLEPRDGVAGFDSGLYMHLKRHWDVNPRPSSVVSWYIQRFRKTSDTIRGMVETRVKNLQRDWNSYVKTLMPTDMELTKTNKASANATSSVAYPTTRKVVTIEPKGKRPAMQAAKRFEPRSAGQGTKKKRKLDLVDELSERNRVHVRCRFNSKEKDMLILIRAVGFFLNPVYRFWLDPVVLRDIMHEYVPESRTKTVQSLMAAGVREMVRPNRLAYLQRIVRNLSTFKEMREMRQKLALAPVNDAQEKKDYFKNAFQVANRLLFLEYQSMPHVKVSNEAFDNFLSSGNIVISAEEAAANPIPLRSRRPAHLQHIQHCVAINILVSILIQSSNGTFPEQILDQIPPAIIQNALSVLRSDGLVSRSRQFDQTLNVVVKNQAMLSYYFRHFFAHRFHPELVTETSNYLRLFRAKPANLRSETLVEDSVGLTLLAASAFYNLNTMCVGVDQDMLSVFDEIDPSQEGERSTKQIRYLENADLKLEKIECVLIVADEVVKRQYPSWKQLIRNIDRSKPVEEFVNPITVEEFALTQDQSDRAAIRAIYRFVDSKGIVGASIGDIARATATKRSQLATLLDSMSDKNLLQLVGSDQLRYATIEHSNPWMVEVGGRKVSPRPWTLPNGTCCPSTLRWMAESVLMAIVSSPGITKEGLRFRFEFALQPICLDELLALLAMAGCITISEEIFSNMELTSPFAECSSKRLISYILPMVDSVERFAAIFGEISLLPTMLSGKETEYDRYDRSTVANMHEATQSAITNVSLPRMEPGSSACGIYEAIAGTSSSR